MPTPSELLRRFRLMAVPGLAAVASVPADRREALRMELEPVFAALRATNEATAATVARAEEEGETRRTRASEEASAIIASTRETARDVRAEAAAELLARAANERRDLLEAAQRRAAVIGDRAELVIQPAVDELVRRVLAIGTTA